jgi:uncharacterized protein DUF2855
MSDLNVTRLLTDKNDLGRTEADTSVEPAAAGPGEILLKLDRFSITANNITYAAFGDAMNYWRFFPTSRPGFGHMPVWGFADVVSSSVPGVAAGERFYGYYPIASHVRMLPERVTARGFYDGAEHRRGLTSAYNQYMRCSADPAYAPERENYQALFRPLFLTSFMLADFLDDNGFFGARQLLVSSASSKTAYGTAFCLKDEGRVKLMGLTSPGNAAFVRGLGCYAETALYADVETLDPGVPTLYVDFSGDTALRARIHRHFGSALVYDCYAGSAANTEFLTDQSLPGPAPAFYFAPVQIKKRNADWGPAIVNQRFNEAQTTFIAHVSRPENPWIRIVEGAGFDAAQTVIASVAGRGGDPAAGHIIRLP